MRRRAAQQDTARVSLFPFLAVLICTMGALIMLLVVIARQARAESAQVATQGQTEADEELQIKAELLELRIRRLREQRGKTEADLNSERRKLSHVEDHARRLHDELTSLNVAMAAIDSETSGNAAIEQLSLALVHLKDDLADTTLRIEDARKSSGGANRSFAVIPFQGPHETRRRPLYIECRADAIILQPEGIKLTEKDFQGPLSPGNPLAAGLRAASEHLIRRAAASPDHAGEPYPLLLVRPDGILAYYVARASLKSWGSEFGYELIDENWKLEFEPPDPQLAEVERRAVERARMMQHQLARFAPRRYGIGRGGNRSFQVDADEPLLPDGSGFSGEGGRGGYGTGTDSERLPEARGKGRYAPSANPRLTAGGSRGTGGGSAGDVNVNWPYDNLPLGAAGDASAAGGPMLGAQGPDAGGQGDAADDSMLGLPGNGGFGQTAGGTPGHTAATPPSGTRQAAGGLPGGASSSQGQGSGSRRTGDATGSAARSSQYDPAATFASDGDSQLADQGHAGEAPSSGAAGQGVVDDPFTKNQGTSAIPIESKHRSLAQQRGRDWGLPAAARGAVPITRPISIICTNDRAIILSDELQPANVIRFSGRTVDSIDDLVSTVWDQVDGWGMAGQGMYWRPVLAIDVAPDGEARFGALAALLDGSGLEVKRKTAVLSTGQPPSAAVDRLPAVGGTRPREERSYR